MIQAVTTFNYVRNKKMKIKLSVIGLGYVGLPLAIEFGKIYNTLGKTKEDFEPIDSHQL